MSNRYHTLRAKKLQGKPRRITKRPKTFKSEESAKKYAETNGIKKYTLENLKTEGAKEKKLRIIENF